MPRLSTRLHACHLLYIVSAFLSCLDNEDVRTCISIRWLQASPMNRVCSRFLFFSCLYVCVDKQQRHSGFAREREREKKIFYDSDTINEREGEREKIEFVLVYQRHVTRETATSW